MTEEELEIDRNRERMRELISDLDRVRDLELKRRSELERKLELQLRKNAVWIVGLVQATMGLEGQAVDPDSVEEMIQKTMEELRGMEPLDAVFVPPKQPTYGLKGARYYGMALIAFMTAAFGYIMWLEW